MHHDVQPTQWGACSQGCLWYPDRQRDRMWIDYPQEHSTLEDPPFVVLQCDETQGIRTNQHFLDCWALGWILWATHVWPCSECLQQDQQWSIWIPNSLIACLNIVGPHPLQIWVLCCWGLCLLECKQITIWNHGKGHHKISEHHHLGLFAAKFCLSDFNGAAYCMHFWEYARVPAPVSWWAVYRIAVLVSWPSH